MNKRIKILLKFLVIILIFLFTHSLYRTSSYIASAQNSIRDKELLIFIPEGEFIMGAENSDKHALDDEKPKHKVWLADYWIDRTEVTNKQYSKCVSTRVCKPPKEFGSYSRSQYYGNPQFDNYPVIYVSWFDAETYCKWAGKRLPTEAEWEKAARGNDERIYPWGNSDISGSLTNFADKSLHDEYSDLTIDDGYIDTSPVNSLESGASPYGVLNMAGNVSEWVEDLYDVEYYLKTPYKNPKGEWPLVSPFFGRVYRGGSWDSSKSELRSSARRKYSPGTTNYHVGFRCAWQGLLRYSH